MHARAHTQNGTGNGIGENIGKPRIWHGHQQVNTNTIGRASERCKLLVIYLFIIDSARRRLVDCTNIDNADPGATSPPRPYIHISHSINL